MSELPGIALIYVPVGADPDSTFAGRSLVERGLALAASAGLRPYLVDRRPSRGGRAPIAGASWLEPGTRLPGTGPQTTVVLWRCDVAWVSGVLRGLLARAESSRVALLDDLGRPALAVLPASRLAGAVPASVAVAAGSCAILDRPGQLGSSRLIALATAEADPEADAPQPSQAGGIALATRGMAPGRAAVELVATLENPRDGIFDRLFNRHLSRRITPLVLGLPVTPNQVTVLSLLVGFLAAGALAQPGILWPIAGALLLQLTAVLDCVDGEIARAKVLESDWGELLDITSDSVIHVVVFLGMAAHAWPQLGTQTAWTLGGVFATGGFASFVVVTLAERSEDRWKPLGTWQASLLGQLLATLTTRDLSVLVLAAAATGLMTELLMGAAIGAHVFWLTALLLHREVMRQVAERERASAVAAQRAAQGSAEAPRLEGSGEQRSTG